MRLPPPATHRWRTWGYWVTQLPAPRAAPTATAVCTNPSSRSGASRRTPVLGRRARGLRGRQRQCASCHEGKAILAAWGVTSNYAERGQTGSANYLGMTCAVCHDPHGSAKKADGTPLAGQLRFPIDVADANQNLCMKCHQRRSQPDSTAVRGPHSPQGPMLLGDAGYKPAGFDPDVQAVATTHGSERNPRLCAGCHVNQYTVTDAATGAFQARSVGHLFLPIPCLGPNGIPTADKSCPYDATARMRDEEEAAEGDQREWLYRLRKTCESGLIAAELAEKDDELENAILAARLTFKGEELPLRSALARLAVISDYKERDELGELHGQKSAEFNEQRLELLRAYEELEADLTEEPDAVARNEEEKQISLRELEVGPRCGERPDRRCVHRDARTLVRAVARTGPRGSTVVGAHGLRAPPFAARLDVLKGPGDRRLSCDAVGARLRPRRGQEHPVLGPRRPAPEVSACLRHRLRPAERRAPDHPRAGRTARLSSVPPRSRSRTPLRRCRPESALHVPQDLPRSCADRDLLVHLRGDHPRAGLAR